MTKLVVLLVGWLTAVPALPQYHNLELRANANAYQDPDRQSDVVAQLRPRTDGKPQLLKLVSAEKQIGYYHIEIPGGSGRTGWVYKSYVRGYDTAPTDRTP